MEEYNFRNEFLLSCGKHQNSSGNPHSEQVSYYTIYWIKKGKGSYSIDFQNYDFDDNVIFFLSPNQIFSIKSEETVEVYKISFVKDFYCVQTHDKEVSCNGVLFNNIYETPYVKPCEKDTNKLSFILDCLIEEFKQKDIAQHDMLLSYLKQFMILAVRIQKELSIVKNDTETKLFKDFSLLVEQNYKEIHNVSDYASKLALSPKSLTKNFQRVGVETPSDYIKNRILLEAKRKLIYTNTSVKEIAYDLGYQDAAYFSRFFTKSENKSPIQYRKQYNAA